MPQSNHYTRINILQAGQVKNEMGIKMSEKNCGNEKTSLGVRWPDDDTATISMAFVYFPKLLFTPCYAALSGMFLSLRKSKKA